MNNKKGMTNCVIPFLFAAYSADDLVAILSNDIFCL
jgi:hypothetical protein